MQTFLINIFVHCCTFYLVTHKSEAKKIIEKKILQNFQVRLRSEIIMESEVLWAKRVFYLTLRELLEALNKFVTTNDLHCCQAQSVSKLKTINHLPKHSRWYIIARDFCKITLRQFHTMTLFTKETLSTLITPIQK